MCNSISVSAFIPTQNKPENIIQIMRDWSNLFSLFKIKLTGRYTFKPPTVLNFFSAQRHGKGCKDMPN